MSLPQDSTQTLLDASDVHAEWQPILQQCLTELDPFYIKQLLSDDYWLPGRNKLFAAFQRDLSHCQYILLGESPYPRKESANGIAFHDAAVKDLWSETGLSKQVNRATSLRNIIKTALLAEGWIQAEADGKVPQALIAGLDKRHLLKSITELFSRLHESGFLMFNVTPVLHPQRSPLTEARYWHAFMNRLLREIRQAKTELPTLILWGKIAGQIGSMESAASYPKIISEHPYNLSFIHNPTMHSLFARLKILQA